MVLARAAISRCWRGDCDVLLHWTAPKCFLTAACMVSAAASSYHSRHCPAAASGSTKGLVDPSASGLSLHLSLLLGLASETAKTFAFFDVCRRGPRPGCLGPHEAVGVRTGGRLQGKQGSDC